MNADQLNEYLLKYIGKKQVPGAIMITASWGSGKTYYITNELVPFLEEKGVIDRVANLSLYSVTNIESLCKGLFLQFTLNKPGRQSKTATASKLVAKTIYNGMFTHWGLDFKYTEKEYRDLYSLLNLSRTLVILEDIERSKIPILKLMGFVNNLTELDNVKVLLIVNELELINDLGKNYDKYVKIKEKSVYDTIELNSVNICTIENILNTFEDSNFVEAVSKGESLSKEIYRIMCDEKIDCYNLRSLKFALQKTADLFNSLTFSVNQLFLKHVFLSIVAYALKKKKQDNLQWIDENRSPSELGTEEYPLYRYCYDFIMDGRLDSSSMERANASFIERKNFELKQKAILPVLETIYSFYIKTEKQIVQSLEYIEQHPEVFSDMPVTDRVRLYNYFLAIGESLPEEKQNQVLKCKELLKNSFRNQEYRYDPWMYDGIALDSDDSRREWVDFKKYVLNFADNGKDQLFGFDYTVNSISKMNEAAIRGYYTDNHKFVSLIEVKPFISMIKQCSALQIDSLRGLFLHVYGFENIYSFFMDDLLPLKELRDEVKDLEEYNGFDSIQKLQIKYFVSNLDVFILKLESHGVSRISP